MAEIVNLRQARKAKARQQAEHAASQNRVAFGRSKAEKSEVALMLALAQSRLEGHRIDPGATPKAQPKPAPDSADDGKTSDASNHADERP
jgi:hypothetical protein